MSGTTNPTQQGHIPATTLQGSQILQLTLLEEIMAVHCDSHTACRYAAQFVGAKSGGTHSYHCPLEAQTVLNNCITLYV